MVDRLIQALTVAALAATTTLGAAGPASADRWWGGERAGDVRQWSYSPEPPPCGTTEVTVLPRDASTDIVGLSVRHEDDAVEVRAHFRDLAGWGDRWLDFSLRTDGRDYTILLLRDPAKHPNASVLWDSSQPPSEPDECGSYVLLMGGVPCPDLTMDRSSQADVVSVQVPRSCLGSPRWVRASVDTRRTVDGRTRFDTWRTAEAGHASSSVGGLGPRVRHSP
ncbi:MAG TPA: hypothetical protein VEW73_10700 [Nocardioides sp.]|nr:hypothetical protein [Nocardioides sp.]